MRGSIAPKRRAKAALRVKVSMGTPVEPSYSATMLSELSSFWAVSTIE